MNKADMQSWYLFEQEMNASNSTLAKKEVLQKWKDNGTIQWILRQTYDPFTKYYVSKKALQKLKFADPVKVHKSMLANKMLFPELLTLLSTRKMSGHEALHTSKYFIDNCGFGDVALKIFNGDAELRVGTTLINEAMNGLIPTFECQLAEKYDSKRVDLEKDVWFMSRKLDGVRDLIVINNAGSILFFSRSGQEYTTLEKIRLELEPLGLRNVVLDGEVCLVDENGAENFQGVMKEVTRKNFTMENPKFICFDIITFKEFIERVGEPHRTYKVRYMLMQEFFEANKFNYIELLEHIPLKTEADREAMAEKSKKLKWEGYMLNKDVPYKGKRSYDLLKGKIMEDLEAKVIETVNGLIRVIKTDEEGNKYEVEEEMLSAVIIEYKGATVRVGSGFSQADRRLYYEHPELIVNMIITVQYFEETTDKNGKLSLRFPVFKVNHGIKRTT